MSSGLPNTDRQGILLRTPVVVAIFFIAIAVWTFFIAPWLFTAAQEYTDSGTFALSIPCVAVGLVLSFACAWLAACVLPTSSHNRNLTPETFFHDVQPLGGAPKTPADKEAVERQVVEALEFVADQKRNLSYVLRRDDGNRKVKVKSLSNLISIAKFCKANCSGRLDELVRSSFDDEELQRTVDTALSQVYLCDDVESELGRLKDEGRTNRQLLQELGDRCLQIARTIDALTATRKHSDK